MMSRFKFSKNVTFVKDIDGSLKSAFLRESGHLGHTRNSPRNVRIWMSWENGEPIFKELESGYECGLDVFLEQNKGVKEPDEVTVYYKDYGMEDGWKSI